MLFDVVDIVINSIFYGIIFNKFPLLTNRKKKSEVVPKALGSGSTPICSMLTSNSVMI